MWLIVVYFTIRVLLCHPTFESVDYALVEQCNQSVSREKFSLHPIQLLKNNDCERNS